MMKTSDSLLNDFTDFSVHNAHDEVPLEPP